MRTLRAHRVLARRVFVFIIFAMVHRQPRPNDVGGAPRRPPQTAESGHPTLQILVIGDLLSKYWNNSWFLVW